MSLQYIKIRNRIDTGIAIVELNRPAKRNAFNQSMINELIQTLGLLDKNEGIRVVILTATSDSPFCGMDFYTSLENRIIDLNIRSAGMDLNELVNIKTAEAYKRNFLKDLTDAFASFSKPLIASVEGFAVCVLKMEHPSFTNTWCF